MSNVAPERLIDLVCGMAVVVADAQAKGLVLEREERVYAFCNRRCLKDFTADPGRWLASENVTADRDGDAVAIDEGLRRWYASCRCCMHDAYPEVVAALDAERVRAKQVPAGPGICEIADAKVPGPQG